MHGVNCMLLCCLDWGSSWICMQSGLRSETTQNGPWACHFLAWHHQIISRLSFTWLYLDSCSQKNVHFLLLDNWPSVALSRSFMLKSIKLKLYGLQLGCWAGPPQPEFCCWHGILGLPLFPEKPLQATCTKWIQWNLRRTTDPCMQTKTTCCPVAGTQAPYSWQVC